MNMVNIHVLRTNASETRATMPVPVVHSWPNLAHKPKSVLTVVASTAVLLALAAQMNAQVAQIQTQAITLNSAWNLITFQVVPANPSPAAVFGTLGSAFLSAWAYDNQGKQWLQYANPATAQGSQALIQPMGNITV